VAYVDLEQSLEEPGIVLEDVQSVVAETWGAVHQEQAARHKPREALNAAVCVLVGGEVVVFECGGEGHGLAKAECESFAGDGVDGAGGVADEGDVAGGDTVDGAAEGD